MSKENIGVVENDKCSCGANTFYVEESTSWSGSINGGKMCIKNEEAQGFTKIICEVCGADFTDSNLEIEY